MKNDSKISVVAEVDLDRVQFKKPRSFGIDYTNEIDIWAQMEFKFRNRVKAPRMLTDLTSVYYAIRETLE